MAAVSVWRRGNGRLYQAELPQGSTVRELLVSSGPGISGCDFYVTCNGRRVGGDEALQDGLTYSVEPRLRGGKGGFGSMLRALGAQIEKTTNREACRDLSGRRLRDVNHEKAMAEWIKKQAEREAEKEQRRVERLKRKLEEPKHFFTDPEYHQQRSDMSERLEDSVIKGLQASSSAVVSPETSDCCKRRKESPSGEGKSRKKFLWTGVEGLEVSSSSDSDSDMESPGTSASYGSGEQRLHSSDSDSDERAPSSSSSSVTTEARPRLGDNANLKGETPGDQQMDSESDQTGLVKEITDRGQAASGQTSLDEVITEKGQAASGQALLVEEITDKGQAASGQTLLVEEITDKGQAASGQTSLVKEITDKGQAASGQALLDEEITDKGQAVSGQTLLVEEITDKGHAASGQALLVEEITDKGQAASDSACAEHSGAIPQPDKPTITADPAKETPGTDSAPFDLMSFSSSAELEALGLEKLKTELMALGLKCGGTSLERAARLFSVRGMSRDQIDPALFAKPAKAKRK